MTEEEEEEAARGRHICVDCSAVSPLTETNYTLISTRHGWRLTRTANPTGDKLTRATMEWRCPGCWANFRSKSKPPT